MGDRRLSFAGELTKSMRQSFATTISAAVAYYDEQEPKGVQEHMDYYMNQGIDKKEAMKKVAKDRGVGKRDIYKELL